MSRTSEADAQPNYTLRRKHPILCVLSVGPLRSSLAAALIAATAPINPAARADALQDYARECDAAVGVTVPDFDCDAGTEVPGQGNVFSGPARAVTCDEPNCLNQQCDPGSRFQVLVRSNDAFVVAHCRHEGGDTGMYGDIAVIQYSRKNGATCFYQALGDQNHWEYAGWPLGAERPSKTCKGAVERPDPKYALAFAVRHRSR